MTGDRWRWLQLIYNLSVTLLSGIGLFLSAWIVIPAPIFALLPLSVGAPEISPWLILLNSFATLLIFRHWGTRRATILLTCSLLGLMLSLLPLSQLPATTRQATIAMQRLGADVLPQASQLKLKRDRPFVLSDAVRGIALPAVRHTTGIAFANPDGVPLTLEVYQPPQSGQYPAIVVIYGGAWQRGTPADNADCNRYMAAQGYVVWAIDYRHAPRYRFPTQLEDVQTALRFIQQHAVEYETDVNRLALMGRSAGAHLALLAAYQLNSIPIRAVVDYYGPVDLAIGYVDLPRPDPIDVRAVLRAFLGGTPAQLPELYRQASPAHYVTRRLPPTLLIYGGRDRIVKAEFGRSLADRLQALNSPAAYIEIPWAEHAFDAVFNGVSNQVALYYTERFLAWALQP